MPHSTTQRDSARQRATKYLPILIWGVLIVVIAGVGKQLAQSAQALGMQDVSQTALALPTAMGNLKINVPQGNGFWVTQATSATILVRQASASGLPQTINLCHQRKNRPDMPNQIYPIQLAGDWASLISRSSDQQKLGLRSPLVVPQELAKGMPQLKIEGDYQGQLRAVLQPSQQSGQYAMAFASDSGGFYVLGKETWLLWRAKDDAVSIEPGSQFYRHAIRIRRLSGAASGEKSCSDISERLEWQLFTSSSTLSSSQPEVPDAPSGRFADVSIKTSNDGLHHLRLPVGQHQTADAGKAQLEDKALFERASAQGLIRLANTGLIEWMPTDIARAGNAEAMPAQWKNVNLSKPEVMATHRDLHRSANGQFVRAQLQRFNNSRQWLALRVRVLDAATPGKNGENRENNGDWSELPRWQAQLANQNLSLTHSMPAVVARLFTSLPTGWSEWVRVAHWPTNNAGAIAGQNTVRMQITLPNSARAGQRLEILVMGKLLALQGAKLVSNTPACHSNACPAEDLLTLAQIEIGSEPLILLLGTEPRFEQLNPDAAEFARVQLRQGKLSWISPTTPGVGTPVAEVTIQARDGTPLFAQGSASPQAHQLGLAELVGLNSAHTHGVAGVLRRMGQHGVSAVQASLTIAPEWQALADKVLDCVGLREAQWDAKTNTCQYENAPASIPAKRRAAMVWLDAETGDILSAANAPHAPQGVTPADLIAFDRFNPSASPLRVNAWQHDGRSEHNPGSTFKLIDALALEQWAMHHPERQALLAGQSVAQLNSLGSALGFSMQANCYPAPCSRTAIPNFHLTRPIESAVAGQFGVEQALKKSVNTWFAWMVERSDASSAIAPDTLPLGATALDEARPVLAMARRLGFEQNQRLDGGLLPANFAWQAQDHLQTTASHLEAISDVHKIRLQAIGQRVQTTTLQMAQVSAAIASGHLVQPRLLATLNGVSAVKTKGPQLEVELARIRRGMKEVVAAGTAAGAFATPELKALANGVYGKTGTAQARNPDGDTGQDNDTVWFVGYVQAGTLANQPHALAFAVSISHGHQTGGGHAAKVVAALLGVLGHGKDS